MSDREILIEPILTDIGFKPIVDIRLLTLVYTRKMINGVWDTSVSDGAYHELGTRWVFLKDLTEEHSVAQSNNEGLFWVPFNLYAKYIKGNQQENSHE